MGTIDIKGTQCVLMPAILTDYSDEFTIKWCQLPTECMSAQHRTAQPSPAAQPIT